MNGRIPDEGKESDGLNTKHSYGDREKETDKKVDLAPLVGFGNHGNVKARRVQRTSAPWHG